MMNFDTWLDGIISAIYILADEDYQREMWTNENVERFCSWEETYCLIFDDFDFNGFISTYCIEGGMFSNNTCKLLIELRDALVKYGDKISGYSDPNVILSDADWHHVCTLAKKVLENKDELSLRTAK